MSDVCGGRGYPSSGEQRPLGRVVTVAASMMMTSDSMEEMVQARPGP